MTLQNTLGILGFGNMGEAIVSGLIKTGAMSSKHMIAFDVDADRLAQAERLGVEPAPDAGALAKKSDVLLVAMKPQGFDAAAQDLAPALSDDVLVVSIMAGVSIATIQDKLGGPYRTVRVMPNLPALVGAGATAIAVSDNCTDADSRTAQAIFEAVGVVEFVEESAMDVITALSGSGPAYFFYVVECLTRAAVSHGLAPDQAARLAGQTLLGAGRLLQDGADSAGTLRERVTSKGGTTEAALNRFMEQDLEKILAEGVAAAVARSRELGK